VPRVSSFDLLLFGGTGDLALRKLLPALYCRHRAANTPEDFARVAQALQDSPAEVRVFFLSTAPDFFAPICKNLATAGLVRTNLRVVLEKPLGRDLAGPDTYAIVDTALGSVVLRVGGHVPQRVGDPVHLTWEARDLQLFDAETEARIG
jgi:glucose-6-phosphate 1-dehydrogenase